MTDQEPHDLGAALIEATEDIIRIERGEMVPPRQRIFRDGVLVEVREHGVVTWSAGDPEAED